MCFVAAVYVHTLMASRVRFNVRSRKWSEEKKPCVPLQAYFFQSPNHSYSCFIVGESEKRAKQHGRGGSVSRRDDSRTSSSDSDATVTEPPPPVTSHTACDTAVTPAPRIRGRGRGLRGRGRSVRRAASPSRTDSDDDEPAASCTPPVRKSGRRGKGRSRLFSTDYCYSWLLLMYC